MKRLTLIFVLVTAMACGTQEKQEPVAAPSPEDRIQELEARVASLEKIVALLADELLLKDGRYMLKAGDTGMKVARQFELTIAELQRFNPGVNWSRLVVGQLLRVREEKPNKAPEPTTTAVTPRATPRGTRTLRVLPHASRRLWSWLIFDVRQKTMDISLIIVAVLVYLGAYLAVSFGSLKKSLRAEEERNRRFRSFIIGSLPETALPLDERVRARKIRTAHDVATVADTVERELGVDREVALKLAEALSRE